MKSSYITVTDQFCGAGGSSQGVRNVARKFGGGVEVKLALNHWKLAIETHNTNFPDTLHDCTDISACDPRRYPNTNILITSPECTNHSLAKGQKVVQKQVDMFNTGKIDPAAERSRATMWDVPRFAEYHKYENIIVENVVDARKWIMFDSWIHAMYALGYQHRCVYLNSMFFYPTPQSRDRMYVVFWKKGNKEPQLDFTPLAFCQKCTKNVSAIQSWKNPNKKYGKYGVMGQYVYCCPVCSLQVKPYYYAAFNCIDWSDIGTRIGDRKKPLRPNSEKRINHGIDKHGVEPFIFHSAYSEHARGVIRSVNEPGFTQTTFESQAIINPFIVNEQHSTGVDFRVRSMVDRMDTITTNSGLKLVSPPFIIKGEHTLQDNGYAKSVAEPMQTQTVRQSMALVVPYIIEMNRTGEAKPATEPTATFTAGGINHSMLTMPLVIENKGQSTARPVDEPLSCITTKDYQGLITTEAFNSFISSYNNGSHCTNQFTEAMGAVTTKDRHALVTYQKPKLEDCYYRMLKPHEIQLAMAFDRDYVVLGSGKDKVKQLGNAVTPPVMQWLVERCVESLA